MPPLRGRTVANGCCFPARNPSLSRHHRRPTLPPGITRPHQDGNGEPLRQASRRRSSEKPCHQGSDRSTERVRAIQQDPQAAQGTRFRSGFRKT